MECYQNEWCIPITPSSVLRLVVVLVLSYKWSPAENLFIYLFILASAAPCAGPREAAASCQVESQL